MNQTAGIISTDPEPDFADSPEGPSAEDAEPGPESDLRCGEVSAEQHGMRLDRALTFLVPEFSRSYLQQLQDAGLVQVNGQVVLKASHKVRAGDRLQLELRPTPQSQAFKAEPVAFEIVYEDADILVINKAPGLVVHPAPGNWSGTLLNGLLHFDAAFYQVPRAGIVHRLDKDTSGLMVVARHREVMDRLVQAIAARTVSRQYLALGQGAWSGPSPRSVNAAIGRDPRNRLRMGVVDLAHMSGKTARTDIALLGGLAQCCFVRCTLHTGRTHQIRVHMAHIGHPLVADSLYGGSPAYGLERQALHATRLAFEHPVSAKPLVFESAPPADFAQALEICGLRYNPQHS